MAKKCTDIAIIGLAGRFPCADSVEELGIWDSIFVGKDALLKPPSEVEPSGERRADEGWYSDEFDKKLFGMTPEVADSVDPEQRVLLEVTWEGLENAGIPPSTLSGTEIPVFFRTPSRGAVECMSRFFGLNGTSAVVDSSDDASGAIAVHLASESLRNGKSDLAIAGEVSVLSENSCVNEPMKSEASGSCDESTNGILPSEGCGVVVLKRYDDAVRDLDHIWGIIRGSASAQDEESNGLPGPDLQGSAFLAVLGQASAEPENIRLVEVHATVSEVEDQEYLGLTQVFEASLSSRKYPLIMGSTKTKPGRRFDASGLLNLVKVLYLKHQTVPKSRRCQNPKSDIRWHYGIKITTSPLNSESSDSEAELENEDQPRKKQRKSHTWTKVKCFTSGKEALDFVKSEKLWRSCGQNYGVQGRKISYNCKVSSLRTQEFRYCQISSSVQFRNWKRFDTYVKSRNSVWKVDLNTTEYTKSSCTCPSSFKTYICKHICGIAIIQNLFLLPPEAKNIPIGEKRKRGRPSKAKKALIVQ